MHTRMLELARNQLMQEGCDVLGSYISPVNDAYWKKDLAPAVHRIKMCQLAAESSGERRIYFYFVLIKFVNKF